MTTKKSNASLPEVARYSCELSNFTEPQVIEDVRYCVSAQGEQTQLASILIHNAVSFCAQGFSSLKCKSAFQQRKKLFLLSQAFCVNVTIDQGAFNLRHGEIGCKNVRLRHINTSNV